MGKQPLRTRLKERSAPGPYNLVSMAGGKWRLGVGDWRLLAEPRDESLVFRPLARYHEAPALIDLDLRYPAERPQPDKLFRAFAADLEALLECTAMVVRKPRLYEKGGQWRGGCHIYLKTRLPHTVLPSLFQTVEDLCPEFPGNTNPRPVDRGVFFHTNGLVWPGSLKKGAESAGRYLCLDNPFDHEWLAQEVFRPEPPPKPLQLRRRPHAVDLDEFLKATEGYTPKNREWKQLLMFFATNGYDPATTAAKLNAAWAPDDPDENLRFMTRYAHKPGRVGMGSLLKILHDHGKGGDNIKVLGVPWLHNQVMDIVRSGRNLTTEFAHQMLINTYGHLDTDRNSYIYKTLESNKEVVVTRPLTMFGQGADREIWVEGEATSIRATLYDLMKRSKLRRYDKLVVQPYLVDDPAPHNLFNMWTGFDLMRVLPATVTLETTAIHKWLWHNLAGRDTKKMAWLMSWIGHKIQHPAQKIKKFLVFYSEKEGVGKSTFQVFLEQLLDKDKVLQCQNIATLFNDKNAEQLNKLVICLDDIEQLSRAQSDQLKARITSNSFGLRKMRQDRVEVADYGDFVCTSNDPNPCYLGPDNRRFEIVQITPHFKQGDPIWTQLYRELDDRRLMAAFFHFFLTYPLVDVGNSRIRVDPDQLERAKLARMPIVYRFVTEAFKEADCFERFAQKRKGRWNSIFHPWACPHTNHHSIFVKPEDLWEMFQHWRRNNKKQINRSTFFKQLEQVGAKKAKKSRNVLKNSFPNRPTLVCLDHRAMLAPLRANTSRLLNLHFFWNDKEDWQALTKHYASQTNRFEEEPYFRQ